MDAPTFLCSIIMPVYNEGSILESTLEKVRRLKGKHELIVVDGGSTDESKLLAQRAGVVLQSAKGRAQQMNRGVEAAKGAVLLFLHADTHLPPDALLHIGQALSDPSVVGGRFRLRLNSPRRVFRLVERAINWRDRVFGGFTGDQAIFIRARVFRELRGYRDIPLMEDLDLANRMTKVGKVVQLPVTVTTAARRWEQNGVVRTILLMWWLRLLYVLGVSPALFAGFYGDTR